MSHERAVRVEGDRRVVTITRAYDTEPADLWAACTEPERIRRWFLPLSGDLRVGGRYQLEGNAGGTIEACDPPRSLRATWEFGEQLSRITLRVAGGAAGGAELALEHDLPVDAHWEQYGPGAVGIGWDLGAHGLALHVERGERPAEGDAAAAWMASPEARALMIEAAEAWRAADAASGTDPETARAAAERTATAYGVTA
jgi:hypothetical protein